MTDRVLYLLLAARSRRFAVPGTAVVEVIPRVNFRPVPDPPPGVVGLFDYRGQEVPAVDLGELVHGRASRDLMSTRMIVLDLVQRSGDGRGAPSGAVRRVALIAEQVVDTIVRVRQDLTHGSTQEGVPCLGEVEGDDRLPVQVLDLDRLLPGALTESLARAGGAR